MSEFNTNNINTNINTSKYNSLKQYEQIYDITFSEEYYELENTFLDIANSKEIIIDRYDLTNSKILFLLGVHYEHDTKNYDEMKKWYLMAIELKHTDSMYNLAKYYKKNKNYNLMEKYCLMAIESKSSKSMNYLGLYYWDD